MKYRLQRNNYRDFALYEQNKRPPRAYFIPYTNEETLRAVPDAQQRTGSDLVQVLSGVWDFRYYADSADLPKELDTAALAFDEVQVPSTWQRTGYEPPVYLNTRYEFEDFPPNLPQVVPAAIYRKRFELEAVEDKAFLVAFMGAASCIDLYCNGYHIGYSEGAHNTAEFDLSNAVREGENELVAIVHKWCTGTFLECQDMFRENGIFRDVLLYTLPKTFLNDFWLRPQKNSDGSYHMQVTVEVQGEPNGWNVELSVEDLEGGACSAPARERMTFLLDDLHPVEWNAEQPHLYTAYLKLSHGHELSQMIKIPFGFKCVEINSSEFAFNGQLIKFKGVNHHNTNPVAGYCMSYEDYERDLTLMKQLNVNAIRTSHYPPDPHLLMLADRMGFYVVDEADIETHGAEITHHEINLISDDKKWTPRFLDRIKRMFARDRNHPCITMWSLGNEAGGHHCQDACYAFLHAVQPELPVHYEGACRTPVHGYDVHSEMYTDILRCAQIGRKEAEEWYLNKPFFLCEYAHAMGFGPGCLEEYWETFYAHDNLMGGCIWEWADHAVLHDGDGVPLKWTYGGDHGERLHDGNFCVDGLVYPDRRLHTGAYEMQNVYRPVRAALRAAPREALKEGATFTFTNTNRFAAADCLLEWALRKDGREVIVGTQQLAIPAMSSEEMTLMLPEYEPNAEYHIDFYYINADRVIAFEQIALQEVQAEEKIKSKGNLSKALASALASAQLNIVRAWLDNDNWRPWVQDAYRPENLIFQEDGVYAGDEKQFSMTLTEEKLKGGAVKLTAKLTPAADMLEGLQIPRFGVNFVLPKTWTHVKYYGLGERENLPDCRAQAKIGVYETTVADLNEPYLKPQENGTRCEVRWLELTDEEDKGVRITNASRRLSFCAHEYSPETLAAAKHQEDLHDDGAVYLSVDGWVRGTGSSSCGPDTLEQYKIDLAQGLEFSFVVVGI